MSTIIVLMSIFWPPTPAFDAVTEIVSAPQVEEDGAIRYRGIERLLLQFETEVD